MATGDTIATQHITSDTCMGILRGTNGYRNNCLRGNMVLGPRTTCPRRQFKEGASHPMTPAYPCVATLGLSKLALVFQFMQSKLKFTIHYYYNSNQSYSLLCAR